MTLTDLHYREQFSRALSNGRENLVALCADLVRTGSENPPGSTAAIADVAQEILSDIPDLHVERFEPKPGLVSLVAVLRCGAPGRRLVINAHLDTFPIGDPESWSVPPLSGAIRQGRIYGRGASDMKAGLAAALMTMKALAAERDRLCGELVLTLVGDEETGGEWGTGYLLDNVPEASGDGMLSGDAGSPRIIHFGEKGQIWLELSSTGVSSHGAHVHRGRNAISALIKVIDEISRLGDLPCPLPTEIRETMEAAKPISESLAGKGEFETLERITVNLGVIEGGSSINIVPDRARALLDIRMPPGISTADILAKIEGAVRNSPETRLRVLSATEPNATDPRHEIVRIARRNAEAVTGRKVVPNMRIGMSDARLYRNHGIPSIVYGPTSHNMGGADEYVEIEDLCTVFEVHASTAYDFLSIGDAEGA